MTQPATDEELDAGRGYDALFVPALFGVWAPRVVEAAQIPPGAHVLDVACGTGVLARAALDQAGPDGSVVGLDPAPGMIAAAREAAPGIDWVQSSAEALPFEAGSFDRVVSQFGLMFFDDPAAAVSEMLRVLKPGGQVALAMWSDVSANPAYAEMAAFLQTHVGPKAAEAVRIPFRLGDPAQVTGWLQAAGFADIAHTVQNAPARFASPQQMVEVELRGWLPLFGIHLGEDKIAEVLEQAGPALSKFTGADGAAEFTTSAYIVTGTKPG